MKTLYMFIAMFIIINGCSQSSYDYNLENRIIDSAYTFYTQEGIDIKEIVNKLESLMIKHNVLDDNSGESYIKKIQQISKENDLNLKKTELLNDINSIGYIPPSLFTPNIKLSDIDSIEMFNSKLKYLSGISDSIVAKGYVSPQIVANEILEVYDADDFENHFYKAYSLIYIANFIKTKNVGTLKRKLPKLDEDKLEKDNLQNVLKIKAIKDNIIEINGKKDKLINLKPIVKQFILEKSDKIEIELPLIGKQYKSKGMIEIDYNDDSSIELYKSVQDSLVLVFKEIRNENSLKYFMQPFDELDNNKAEIIIDLIPLSVYEALPEWIKE